MIDASLEMPLLVTAAVISDGDKILITRRPKDKRHPGLWEFPGGKVDPGESPEKALRREIREELDAEVQVMDIFEVVFHRYDWGPVLILAYSCRLITRSIHNIGVSEFLFSGRSVFDFTVYWMTDYFCFGPVGIQAVTSGFIRMLRLGSRIRFFGF